MQISSVNERKLQGGRGVVAADVRSRVSEVAEMLDLTNHLQRRASGLAADEKQKVSPTVDWSGSCQSLPSSPSSFACRE